MAKHWLADGLNETELAVVRSLESVARHHEGVAVRIIARPFLRTVEDVDVFLLDEFNEGWGSYTLPVARDIADAIDALANESWVADGIDEHERAILERLKGPQGGFTIYYWRPALVLVISALKGEPWMQDGLDEHEWALVEVFALRHGAAPAYINALVDEPWVRDGLDDHERFLLHLKTRWLSTDHVPAFVHFVSTLDGEAWMQDGLDDHERYLLELVIPRGDVFSEGSGALIAHFVDALATEPCLQDGLSTDERWLLSTLPWENSSYRKTDTTARVHAINALLDEPWLQDGLNQTERFLAQGLARLPSTASADAMAYVERVLGAAWVRDGVDENEYLFLLQAFNASNFGALIRTMAKPSFRVIVEKRVITLPLSGEVPLVIIRSRPGSARTMDGLEYAVRGVETLIGARLPVPVVRLILDSYGGGLGNHGDYMVFPADADGTDWLDAATIHEIARLYVRTGMAWARDGTASIIEDIVGEPRSGKPVDAHNYPCARATSIAELERQAHYRCNYALGKRILVDMYRTLGTELFQQGLRDFRNHIFDIQGLRTAFTSAAPDQAEAVDAVVARWYDGPQPRGVPLPDTGPANPELEGLRGHVAEADIALRDGTPAADVDPQKASQGIWLRLEFSFQHIDAPREVTTKVVGHYEDGFAFFHSVRTFHISAGSTGHTEWEWLDIPTSHRDLVPGRYRVDVYHVGNKVAEAAFRVDPS